MQADGKCTDSRKIKKVVDGRGSMIRGGDGFGEGPGECKVKVNIFHRSID